MTAKVLVKVAEAAEMLSLSEKTVRELAIRGSLERVFIGEGKRDYRITIESIHTYVDGLPRVPVAAS